MATLNLIKPSTSSQSVLPITDQITDYTFDFDLAEALIEKIDDNLVITFSADNSSIVLEDFYAVYNAEFMPNFVLDGELVLGEDFFNAVDPNLMPAAGPAASEVAQDTNGVYSTGGRELDGGITALGGRNGGSAYNADPTLLEGGGSQGEPDDSTPANVEPTISLEEDVTKDVSNAILTTYDDPTADSNTGRTEMGSFTFTPGNDLADVTINGKSIFNENGDFVGGTIKGAEGSLTIIDYDPATGKVDYKYTQTAASTHPKNDILQDKFEIEVTDQDGDSATGSITVEIVDDNPEAYSNTHDPIQEGAIAKGNILTDQNSDGKVDDYGADGKNESKSLDISEVVKVGNKSVSFNKTVDTDGKIILENDDYGTITFDKEGNYTFKSNANTISSDTGFEFTYTIIDGDGDIDTATLTVKVDAATGPTIPDPDGYTVEVDESDLATGTNPFGTEEQASWTPDTGYTLTSIDDTSYDSSLYDVWIDKAGSLNVVLKKSVKHADSSNHDESSLDKDANVDTSIRVTVKDDNGNFFDVDVNVTIKDDGPTITDDSGADIISVELDDAKESEEVSGDLDLNLNFGADGKASEQSIILDVDGDEVEGVYDNGVYSFDIDNVGLFTLTENGDYTFTTVDEYTGDANREFTLKITDGDNDTAEVKINVNIDNDKKPGITTPPDDLVHTTYDAAVEEPAGNGASGKQPTNGTTTNTIDNSFSVDYGDDLKSIIITGKNADGDTVDFDLTKYSDENLAELKIFGEYGNLSGFSFDKESGEIEYTYTQTKTYDHDVSQDGATGNDISDPTWLPEYKYKEDVANGDSFKITVFDTDDDKAESYIKINIVDDVLVIGNLKDVNDEFADAIMKDGVEVYVVPDATETDGDISSIVNGKLDIDGADDLADLDVIIPEHDGTPINTTTVTVGGESKVLTLVLDGDTMYAVVGNDMSDPYFTFTLNDDGSWTYTQLKGFTGDVSVVVKGTDADGDSDTHFINFQGNEDSFPADLVVSDALKVDESGLDGGTNASLNLEEDGGSIFIKTKDGANEITIEIAGVEIEFGADGKQISGFTSIDDNLTNGVLSGFELVAREDGSGYDLKYTYTQDTAFKHTSPDDSVTTDEVAPAGDSFDVSVTTSTGTVSTTVNVEITDDAPTLNVQDTVTVDAEGCSTAIVEFNIGADNSSGSLNIDGTVFNFTTDADGNRTWTLDADSDHYPNTVSQDDNGVWTLKVNHATLTSTASDTTWLFTTEGVTDDEDIPLEFTITDADGDTTSDTLIVKPHTSETPDNLAAIGTLSSYDPGKSYDISIMLDASGSMSEKYDENGNGVIDKGEDMNYLDASVAAARDFISGTLYEHVTAKSEDGELVGGDVNVHFVVFSSQVKNVYNISMKHDDNGNFILSISDGMKDTVTISSEDHSDMERVVEDALAQYLNTESVKAPIQAEGVTNHEDVFDSVTKWHQSNTTGFEQNSILLSDGKPTAFNNGDEESIKATFQNGKVEVELDVTGKELGDSWQIDASKGVYKLTYDIAYKYSEEKGMNVFEVTRTYTFWGKPQVETVTVPESFTYTPTWNPADSTSTLPSSQAIAALQELMDELGKDAFKAIGIGQEGGDIDKAYERWLGEGNYLITTNSDEFFDGDRGSYASTPLASNVADGSAGNDLLIGGMSPEDLAKLIREKLGLDDSVKLSDTTIMFYINTHKEWFANIETSTRDADPDALIGGAGDDTIFGQDSDDLLIGDGNIDDLKELASKLPGLDANAYDEEKLDDESTVADSAKLVQDLLDAANNPENLEALKAAADAMEDNNLDGTTNDGNDILYGDVGSDILLGLGGDDYLNGGDNDDIILGGSGNDFILGGSGDDIIFAGSGHDTIFAGTGNNTIYLDDTNEDGTERTVTLANGNEFKGTIDDIVSYTEDDFGGEDIIHNFDIENDILDLTAFNSEDYNITANGNKITISEKGEDGATQTITLGDIDGNDITLDTDIADNSFIKI